MNAVTSFIAKVGVNPYWIAFNAHFWFAYAVVLTFPGHRDLVGAAVVLAAGVKEFWFDANYETPKQSAFDNWTDFAGYACGAWLALLVS